MPSCAGLISVHHKIAVAKALADALLPRVGDDVGKARDHMQRTLNALVAPDKRTTAALQSTADSAGNHEIKGPNGYRETLKGPNKDIVVGNPVHGMGDEEGMGILPHLGVLGEKARGETNARVQKAIRMVELAREHAADCLKLEDVSAFKQGGKVIASLLGAAQEALPLE